ncbi:MAG: hypothetical protein IPK19_01275 [Chloroflexi bacterium]|nr:hypothetical protein [Chloroflexota bacterium]
MLTLPAGLATRVEGKYLDTTTSPSTVYQEITYALFTGDEIYTLDLWVASSYEGDYGPVIDAIATSFHQDASNL